MITRALFALIIVSLSLTAYGHPLGRYCDGRQIVTGTTANQRHLRGIADPALVQAAALIARVDEAQQGAVEGWTRQLLRQAGLLSRYDHETFDTLLWNAKQGRVRADTTAGIIGATTGVVSGVAVGKGLEHVIGVGGASALGGALLGGTFGSQLARETLAGSVKIVLEQHVFNPVMNDLIRNPCEITAGEALERLRVPD